MSMPNARRTRLNPRWRAPGRVTSKHYVARSTLSSEHTPQVSTQKNGNVRRRAGGRRESDRLLVRLVSC